jgi:hypothetical protein
MKKGNRVQVFRTSVGDERGRYGHWVLDATVGKTGTVLDTNGLDGAIWVQVDDTRRPFYYPPQCLVMARPLLPGHGPNNTHLAQELPR